MTRVVASVEEVAHPITSPLPLEESRADFQRSLSSSLAYSLIGRWWNGIARVLRWLTRRKEAIPFPIVVICWNLFSLALGTTIALLLGESAIMQPYQLRPPMIWAGFTIVYVLVMHTQLSRAAQILSNTIAESIPSADDFTRLDKVIQSASRLFWHVSFSFIFAMICGVWVSYLLWLSAQAEVLIGAMVIYVFNYFQVGMYIYFVFVMIVVLLALSRFELDIYANDPRHSPVIQRVYHSSSMLTLCVAALGALHYLVSSVLNVDLSVPLALTILIIFGWMLPLALFIATHLSLARIMGGVKGRKLAQLQETIQQIERESNPLEREPLESIQRLMDYHDRIKATPNSMINLSSLANLLGSLLLPLLATILANLNTIVELLR